MSRIALILPSIRRESSAWFSQPRTARAKKKSSSKHACRRSFSAPVTFAATARGFVSAWRLASFAKRAAIIVWRTAPVSVGLSARITEAMSFARKVLPTSARAPRTASKACSPKTPYRSDRQLRNAAIVRWLAFRSRPSVCLNEAEPTSIWPSASWTWMFLETRTVCCAAKSVKVWRLTGMASPFPR